MKNLQFVITVMLLRLSSDAQATGIYHVCDFGVYGRTK